MRVNLIAGGSGFIGTNLALRLKDTTYILDRAKPQARDRQWCPMWYPFLYNPTAIIPKSADLYVYFLQSQKIPMFGGRLYSTVDNLESLTKSVDLIRCARAKFRSVKVFYASTSDVYGNVAFDPKREVDSVGLGSPESSRWSYGACKIVGEHLFMGLMEELNIPVIVGRIFSAYGPYGNLRDPWKAGIQQVLLYNAIKGLKTTIYGDGRQSRTYIYVEDLVKAIEHLFDNEATGVFNLCSNGPPMRVNDLISLVEKIHGEKLDIEYKPYEAIKQTKYSDVLSKHGSNRKLKEAVPGWEPLVDLERGLHMTYLWLKDRV